MIVFQLIFVFSILGYKDMMAGGTYVYPDWSINMGWLMTASSIMCVPAYFFYKLCKASGTFTKVSVFWLINYLKVRTLRIGCRRQIVVFFFFFWCKIFKIIVIIDFCVQKYVSNIFTRFWNSRGHYRFVGN